MKRKLVLSGILLFAVSCFAQKNEVDVLFGNTWSFTQTLLSAGRASWLLQYPPVQLRISLTNSVLHGSWPTSNVQPLALN